MAKFCKSEDCPTSQDLLAYQTGEMEVADGREIRRHIAACEFCAAEIEFYEHYPPPDPVEELSKTTRIPGPLYDLAESLLSKKHGSRTMEKLMSEIDSVDD